MFFMSAQVSLPKISLILQKMKKSAKKAIYALFAGRPSIEGLPAKRAYIAFLADFHFFLQDQANFWQTDLC